MSLKKTIESTNLLRTQHTTALQREGKLETNSIATRVLRWYNKPKTPSMGNLY